MPAAPSRSPSRSQTNSLRAETPLTVTTLNVGAAAIPRARDLLRWVRRRASDVVVLTETSAGAGSQLIADGLANSGYAVCFEPDGRDRGVLVASRRPVKEVLHLPAVTLAHRACCVVLDCEPEVSVLGVYVPSRDRSPAKVERKRVFIASLLSSVAWLPAERRASLMIVGDYNVVSRRHEPPLRGYFSFEYDMLDELEALGFRSGHEICPAKRFPYSWMGRTGAGYLYDYLHVGSALQSRIERCAYMQTPRTHGLTDHAGITLSCRMGSVTDQPGR